MKYLKKFENHTAYEEARQNLILPNVSLCVSENEVHYNPIEPETRLVCKYNVTSTSSPTALRTIYGQDAFNSMEIDGVQLDSLVSAYTFDSVGVHIVKYELYDETIVGRNNTPLFYQISSLIEASIPNSVTSIELNAFNTCPSLSSITIPKNITRVNDNAFRSCSGLTSIVVENGNSIYDSRNNCNAIIETTTNKLIQGCNYTTIPNSVTSIGLGAFAGMSMVSITIPSSVTYINNEAFYWCLLLTSITVEATTPPTLSGSAFDYTNDCPIYVPAASVDTYKAASGWSTYASRIQAIP